MNSFGKEMTKEELIQFGLQYLDGVGISWICNVCISNGGSCCMHCIDLEDGKGCQQRNTSCTSWLCGFLKFILYEAGLLDEWQKFWEQVPGQAFRTDYTPDIVSVQKELLIPEIKLLGQAFSNDLIRLTNDHHNSGRILELNDLLDRYITRFSVYKDKSIIRKAKDELDFLKREFIYFQFALQKYKNYGS